MAAIAEGIYVGSAALISGVPGGEDVNGRSCQILEHLIDSDKCEVLLTTGVTTEVETKYLKPPSGSFDVMLGPCQQPALIGEEISRCLFSNGFCVVKVCQETAKVAEALESMQLMEEEGKLMRLPEAVEAGYFGSTGSKAKVCWLSGNDGPQDALIRASDDLVASIVDSILPSSLDTLGAMIESRSPALVGVTLSEDELSAYPYPSLDDKALYDYLQTYRQGLLRAVLYMGPANSSVTLKAKEDSGYSQPAPFDADAGTLVLYRPKCFEYSTQASSSVLSITATFLSKSESPSLVAIAGEFADLALAKGAPPPKRGVTVENTSTRMSASYDDPAMYQCGQAAGTCCGIEIPFARFDYSRYYEPDPTLAMPWNSNCMHMGYVEGLEYFDNKYFSIPAAEASTMDTMHRHVMEVGGMNLYKMGISKKVADKEPRHGGCAIALDKDDWQMTEKDEALNGAGVNVQAILANRFSFTFNLKGASLVVDTACSSSLTAAHIGKNFLVDRSNDKLDFWVAIGLHQCLNVLVWLGNGLNHMFSTIGRCATFNDTADGYLRGDNCAGIVMNYDSPTSLTTWRGSMVGQNGRSATLTAPNGLAQEDVITKALRDAGMEPAETSIWSCHGTGTSLGDPIELGTVRKVQIKNGRPNALCVNTNKVNTGHSEGAAAMTSLVSMVLQLGLQRVNGNIHLNQFNSYITMDQFDAFFNTEIGSTHVEQANGNVSSFGFGGTNCHGIMWGKRLTSGPTESSDLLKAFSLLAYPEVRVIGNDPDEWEFDGFDAEAKTGDTYAVKVTEHSKKYVLMEEAVDATVDGTDVAYSIQGNFGETVPMEDGMVPGMKNVVVEVPENGEVEFNFCQTIKPELVLAPKVNACRKKSAPCEGPAEGLENMWRVATGAPGSELRIDLFICNGMHAVSWATL